VKHFAMVLALVSVGSLAAQAQSVKEHMAAKMMVDGAGGDFTADSGGTTPPGGYPPPPDTSAPYASSILVTTDESGTVVIQTLNPGDNVAVTGYEIGWSIAPIDITNIANTNPVNNGGAPLPDVGSAGTPLTFTMTGFDPDMTYYFGIHFTDAAGNWSDPSVSAVTTPVGSSGSGIFNKTGGGAGWCSASGSMSLGLAALAIPALLALLRK